MLRAIHAEVMGAEPEELPGGAVQGHEELPGGAVPGQEDLPGGAVQGQEDLPGGAVQGQEELPGGAVQGQEAYLNFGEVDEEMNEIVEDEELDEEVQEQVDEEVDEEVKVIVEDEEVAIVEDEEVEIVEDGEVKEIVEDILSKSFDVFWEDAEKDECNDLQIVDEHVDFFKMEVISLLKKHYPNDNVEKEISKSAEEPIEKEKHPVEEPPFGDDVFLEVDEPEHPPGTLASDTPPDELSELSEIEWFDLICETEHDSGSMQETAKYEDELAKEKLEQEKLEQEKLEQEKLEKEKLEKEKLEHEKLEQQKLEQKRLEKENLRDEMEPELEGGDIRKMDMDEEEDEKMTGRKRRRSSSSPVSHRHAKMARSNEADAMKEEKEAKRAKLWPPLPTNNCCIQ